MPSIADKLKARQAERKLKPKDLDLRGSGITKRDFERAEARYEKQVTKSLEKGVDIAAKEASEKFQTALDLTMQSLEQDAKAKNIVLDPSQLKALHGVLSNQVCCLVGAAGTGKTTVTRFVISELSKRLNTVHVVIDEGFDEEGNPIAREEKETVAIAGAAFTGRAAQQMIKAVGNDFDIPIMTIHRLLGYAPTLVEVQEWDPITKSTYVKTKRVFKPSYGKACKLPYKLIILDEASMIGVLLFNELIDAIEPDCRIILIGDLHQLPPVMSKSVLGYAMQKWPTFELAKIHRQAEGNPIIANAHRVLNGIMPQKAPNFVLIESTAEGSVNFSTFIRQIGQALEERKKYDPYRDVIIVPNSNPDIITSAPSLNQHFVTMFNPEKKTNGVVINKRITIHTGTQEVYFAIGDKVIMGRNINTINPPITNGMMGIVESINLNGKYDKKRSQVDFEPVSRVMGEEDAMEFDIDDVAFELDSIAEEATTEKKKKDEESMDQRQASHVMTIKFETGQIFRASTAGDYRNIAYGYAITCHKSQGGEYPNVVIAIHSANRALLTQEWLYTAITRAKENVFLLFNKRGLEMAVRNQKIKGKTIAEKIKNYVIENKLDDMTLSNDPWNVDRTKFPILFNPRKMDL